VTLAQEHRPDANRLRGDGDPVAGTHRRHVADGPRGLIRANASRSSPSAGPRFGGNSRRGDHRSGGAFPHRRDTNDLREIIGRSRAEARACRSCRSATARRAGSSPS
jgi:hypothetical protein